MFIQYIIYVMKLLSLFFRFLKHMPYIPLRQINIHSMLTFYNQQSKLLSTQLLHKSTLLWPFVICKRTLKNIKSSFKFHTVYFVKGFRENLMD